MIKPQLQELSNYWSRDLFLRLFKAFCLLARKTMRFQANRSKFAFRLYTWADWQLCYVVPMVWLLPAWAYRLLYWLCNLIVNANTIDYTSLHIKCLQRFINWVIHRIPDEIRFPHANPLTKRGL